MDMDTDLGPGDILADDDTNYLLSRTEWLTLQTYVSGNIALPDDDLGLRALLLLGADAELEPFMPVLPVFRMMRDHAIFWRDKGYPATVCLANDIINYESGVDLFYGAVVDLAREIEALVPRSLPGREPVLDPDTAEVVALLRSDLGLVLDSLRMEADTLAMRCAVAQMKLAKYANDTKSDQTKLGDLVKIFMAKADAESPEAMRLAMEIMAQKAALDEANEEYEHATIVAATTPTYAWIGFPLAPVGLVAAAVVAGIYGARAVEALAAAEAARKQIMDLESQERAIGLSLAAAMNAAEGLATLTKKAEAAGVVLGRMQGAWSRISSVITNITEILERSTPEAARILTQININRAIRQWKEAAALSDQFVANAFVEVASTSAVMAA